MIAHPEDYILRRKYQRLKQKLVEAGITLHPEKMQETEPGGRIRPSAVGSLFQRPPPTLSVNTAPFSAFNKPPPTTQGPSSAFPQPPPVSHGFGGGFAPLPHLDTPRPQTTGFGSGFVPLSNQPPTNAFPSLPSGPENYEDSLEVSKSAPFTAKSSPEESSADSSFTIVTEEANYVDSIPKEFGDEGAVNDDLESSQSTTISTVSSSYVEAPAVTTMPMGDPFDAPLPVVDSSRRQVLDAIVALRDSDDLSSSTPDANLYISGLTSSSTTSLYVSGSQTMSAPDTPRSGGTYVDGVPQTTKRDPRQPNPLQAEVDALRLELKV